MNIAILGTGKVASVLGASWKKKGHTIVYGSRTPQGPDQKLYAAAVAAADVVVVAIPGTVAASALAELKLDWSGKIVLDATNRFDGGPSSFGGIVPAVSGAHVCKVFNSVGVEVMANPVYGNERAAMFYAGDDPKAKEVARALAADVGFEPVDLGGSNTVPGLEAMVAGLWFPLAQKYGRGTGLRVLIR